MRTEELDPESSLDLTGVAFTTDIADSARSELRANGLVSLDHLWGDATTNALAGEAVERWPAAQPPAIGPRRRVARSRPGDRPTLFASGPILEALHHALTATVRGLTGQLLLPTFAAYAFYQNTDEVRLHLDTDQCDLTLGATVLGPVGPLHVHPELAGMTIGELFALEDDPMWDRESGRPVHHPRSGVTAFRGRQLPHHRPGRSIDGVAAVAAFHFRAAY